MKKITIILIGAFLVLCFQNKQVNSQCSASISADPQIATCGVNTINFTKGYTVATTFDFNSGVLPAGWVSSPYVVSSPCYTNTPDNSYYFWATTLAPDRRRWVITNGVNVSAGGNIIFDMRFGSDDPSPGCEDPDLTSEGVYLQYSNNNGAWTNIQNWVPQYNYQGPLYDWNTYTIPVPSGAIGTNTRFRWYQPRNSGPTWDNWGLDDISIQAEIGGVASYLWNFGDGNTSSVESPIHTYALPGNYNVTLTLTFNNSCVAITSQSVSVLPVMSLSLSGTDPVCVGSNTGSVDLTITNGTSPFTYSWSNGHLSENLSAVIAGTYSVTVTDSYGCTAISSLITLNDPVCTGPTDLNLWSQTGSAGSGNWTVYGGGNVVYQSINGSPTFYVSPETFINTTIEGSFQVQTYSDDDFIGFVFGYTEPASLTTFPMTGHFILFDWKQSNQYWGGGWAYSGYYLSEVNGTFTSGTDFMAALWDHNDPRVTSLAPQYGPGWSDYATYNFELNYSTTNITIKINGSQIYNVNGTFPAGQFGFYNSSQGNVSYSGFTQEFSVGVTATDETCLGFSDGTVTATPSSFGVPPYTYNWSNYATTQTITGLPPGTYTVTAHDSKCCEAIASITVGTLPDVTPPTLTCPPDPAPISADGNCMATIPDLAILSIASDNCNLQPVTLEQSPIAGSLTGLGVSVVTITATDISSNFSTCDVTITVIDDTPPVALCQDVTVYLDAFGTGSVSVSDIDNLSTDNCGIDTYSLDNTNFTCTNISELASCQEFALAFDGSNDRINIPTLNINPTTFPELTFSAWVKRTGSTNSYAQIISNDNGGYDRALNINYNEKYVIFAGRNINTNVTSVLNEWEFISVYWSSTVIKLYKNGILVFTTSGESYVNGSYFTRIGSAAYNGLYLPGVLDEVRVWDYERTESELLESMYSCLNGDEAGLSAYYKFDEGTGSGIINDYTINGFDGSLQYMDIVSAWTTDAPNLVSEQTPIVELTIIDNSGNSSTCESNITVLDIVAPVALCQDITVQLDAFGASTIIPEDIDNNSNDACGIASLALDVNSFNCAVVGNNYVILTVTDVNDNVSSCTATVTVQDNIPPIALCQDITIELDALGASAIIPDDIDFGSNDACGIASLALDVSSFNCTIVGGNPVILTVTDVNNNISTCTATVTVQDNVPPVAICQDITIELDALGTSTIIPEDINFGSNDACGIASLTLDVSSFNCVVVGGNPVILTVTDVNNNISTCAATVTVQDNAPPVALCQDITIELDALGASTIIPEDIDFGSNDACGIASLALDVSSFNCAVVGGNPVILTVTDVNNNISTCAATVTVQDNVPPVALCQDITIELDALGTSSIIPDDIDFGSNDACGIASLALDVSSFNCVVVGGNPVILTVTDVNNNISTCAATVTVQDNIYPTLTCVGNQVHCANIPFSNEYQVVGTEFNLTNTWDNCDIVSITNDQNGLSDLEGYIFYTGNTTVTWTVVDPSGNTSSCSFIVTVNPLPVATITSTTADEFCNGVTLTATSSTTENLYLWSNLETTQSIFLSIANYDPPGVYTVFVTDQNGCTSPLPAEYIYSPEELASSYTIIGFEEAQIGMNNFVQTGSVGLTGLGFMAHVKKNSEVNGPGSFVKADYINIHGTATVSNPIYDPAVIILPTMYYNTVTGISGNITVNSNSTQTITATHKNLKIKENSVVTITGDVYGYIEIYEGCEVTFTSASLDIDRIKVKKSDNLNNATVIKFVQDADVRIKEKVEIEEFCIFNPDEYNVVLFIGDNMGYDGHFQVNAKGVTFNGSVYVPNGQVLIHKDAHQTYPGLMTGIFIADKVHANGKYVYWNWKSCDPTLSSSPAIPQIVFEESDDKGIQLNAYPNPFSSQITIEFEIPESGKVNIEIFNLIGEKIKEVYKDNAIGNQTNKVIFDGKNLESAIYQIKISTNNQILTKKITLIR